MKTTTIIGIMLLILLMGCAVVPKKPCSRKDVKKEILSLFEQTLDPYPPYGYGFDMSDSNYMVLIKDSIDDIFSTPLDNQTCDCEGTVYYYTSTKCLSAEQKNQIIRYEQEEKRCEQEQERCEYEQKKLKEETLGCNYSCSPDTITAIAARLGILANASFFYNANTKRYNTFAFFDTIGNKYKKLYETEGQIDEEIRKVQTNPKSRGLMELNKKSVKYEVKVDDEGKIHVTLYQ